MLFYCNQLTRREVIMNHFKKYSNQCKKNTAIKELISDFDYILDNIWCTYSFEKGRRRWNEVGLHIAPAYAMSITREIEHVWLGHGMDQAIRLAVKHEMEKYIEHLLNERRFSK